MNKYGIAILLGLMTTTPVLAAEPGPTGNKCANDAGIELLGNDLKTTYCQSKISMNWWSAFAWCDMAGGTLFSVDDCMYEGYTGGAQCPILAGTGSPRIWTRSVVDASYVYYVELSTGGIWKAGRLITGLHAASALCKM